MTDLTKLRSTIDSILVEADEPVPPTAAPATAEDLTLQLAALHGKQQSLLLDLHRALLLRKWQPDAFNHGAVRLSFVGATTAPLKTWKASLKLGNGEERLFPVTEVPPELLPDNIKKALKTPLKRLAPE